MIYMCVAYIWLIGGEVWSIESETCRIEATWAPQRYARIKATQSFKRKYCATLGFYRNSTRVIG